MLTERQQQILSYIQEFISDKGYSPSVRDIMKNCGGSISTVQHHIAVLNYKGYIKRDTKVARSITLTGKDKE